MGKREAFSDHSGTSRDLEFTDLISNMGEVKSKDDHKKLCEHYCGKILRGEIGLTNKETQTTNEE